MKNLVVVASRQPGAGRNSCVLKGLEFAISLRARGGGDHGRATMMM
jgi:hypothetical protein